MRRLNGASGNGKATPTATDPRAVARRGVTQLRALWPLLIALYVPVIVALAGVLVIRMATDLTIAELTRDPLQILEAPVYTGAVSVVGGLIWAGTAAICLFSFAILRRRPRQRDDAWFLLAAGGVTAMLMVDDVFMFHEIVFPVHIGIMEELVYAGYIAVVFVFLLRFRTVILRNDFVLLAFALAGFAGSVGIDFVDTTVHLPALYLWEDGAKLFGIVSWSAFFVLAAGRAVERSETPPGPTGRFEAEVFATQEERQHQR